MCVHKSKMAIKIKRKSNKNDSADIQHNFNVRL